MKKILSMAVSAVFSSFMVNAQNNELPTATLQHGDQTMMFVGVDALKSAYDAVADKGDIITLSSGEFNAISVMSKSLTINGAGFEDDEATGTKATVINGGMTILYEYVSGFDDDGNPVTNTRTVDGSKFEGISFKDYRIFMSNDPISDITFAKCKLFSL